jgi:hypothetical protein
MRTLTRALGTALVLGAGGWLLGRRRSGGLSGLLPSGVTRREPEDHMTAPAVGVHYDIADDTPRRELGVPLAPPPVDTPGPSVTSPRQPWSETEREEWAEERKPDYEVMDSVDARVHRAQDPMEEFIAEEESAAAAEASAIGGFAPRSARSPEMDPVYEAGGGDQDGFEQAEYDLRENASHGDGHGNPLRDMPSPELESDRASGQYGEGDEEYSSEVLRDPQEGPDDPGAGPGLPEMR